MCEGDKMANKIRYSEPADYFPKEIREKFFVDCGGIQPLEIIEKEEENRTHNINYLSMPDWNWWRQLFYYLSQSS